MQQIFQAWSRLPRRWRKGWWGLVLLLLAGGLFAAEQAGWLGGANQFLQENQPGLYVVRQVADGDTIVIDMNGHDERVRFVGVDTPETHKPNSPVECYGPAASAYTKRVIGDQRVRLESDALSTNRDRYDRLLRYVYLPADSTSLNEKLISGGYGFYYPHFLFTKKERFAAAQAEAQAAQRGLWGNCTPTPTDGGGYRSNPLSAE